MQQTIAPYTRTSSSLNHLMQGLSPEARNVLNRRLNLVVTTLAGPATGSHLQVRDGVADLVRHDPERLWLASAVLTGELPSDEEMADLLVRARLGGTWAALGSLVPRLANATRFREVEVLREAITCDVHTTASSSFMSGIQRVVRETTSRWRRNHDVEFVAWSGRQTSLRRLADEDHARMFGSVGTAQGPRRQSTIVPWDCTHLWVEVITDLRRTGRLLAMARFSRNQVGVLGYDSIPITSSVTVAGGMTSHFAQGVAATRRANRVATISEAAATEMRGVIQMGWGRRDGGPTVVAVPLAVTAPATTDVDLSEARAGLMIEGLPMVLVVGSHEPRKNHLAVLHAAEVLWREGLQFNLVLIGAGSWNASEYEKALGALLGAGRSVQSIRGLPDRLLWAAYTLAHCTVFPSLNEGFGLPVAESLAVGTPVVTSAFGSMRDIVAPQGIPLGGLLVDPRDDDSVTDGLRTMLSDRATYERLRAETALHVDRTWDDYAAELWDFLVEGTSPQHSAPLGAVDYER